MPPKGDTATSKTSKASNTADAAPAKTKVVIRRAPPTLPEAVLWSSLAGHIDLDTDVDWRSYRPGRSKQQAGTGGQNKEDIASTAYLHFKRHEQVVQFANAFNGHVFRDKQGRQSTIRVEYAPFQRVPAKRQKPDPLAGTIDADPHYLAFLATLNEPAPKPADVIPTTKAASNKLQAKNTPLLQALRTQKQQAAAAKAEAKAEAAKASKKAAAEAAAAAKKAAVNSATSDKTKSTTASPSISNAAIDSVKQSVDKSDKGAAGAGKHDKKPKAPPSDKFKFLEATAVQAASTATSSKSKAADVRDIRAAELAAAREEALNFVKSPTSDTTDPIRAKTVADIDQSIKKFEAATKARKASSDSVTSPISPKSALTATPAQQKKFDPFAMALSSLTQQMANKVNPPFKKAAKIDIEVAAPKPVPEKTDLPAAAAPKPLPAIPSFVGASRGRSVSGASRGRGRGSDIHSPLPQHTVDSGAAPAHEPLAPAARGRGASRGRGRGRGKSPD